MEQEVLNRIIENYNKKIERKKYILKLIDKINKLEENDIVRRYIELKMELESIDYEKIIFESEERILDTMFYSHRHMIKNTNEIYVCIGTFMLGNLYDIEHGPSDIRLKRDDPRAEYRIYRNIENDYSKRVIIDKCEDFEKTHNVIIPNTSIFTEHYYYELQRQFITLAVSEGQEIACKKILERKIR